MRDMIDNPIIGAQKTNFKIKIDKSLSYLSYNYCCNCNHCVMGNQCRRFNKRLSNNDLYRKRKLECWTDILEAKE